MKWITKISLENYRAFSDREKIDIPEGHMLLIYGENGSGKSSLYNALRDLLLSSPLSSGVSFGYKRNEFLPAGEKGDITITVKDGADEKDYIFNKDSPLSTNQNPLLQEANAYKGFLDYRRMLRLHALEVPEGKQPNIFAVLLYDILGDIQIPDPFGGSDYLALRDAYNKLKGNLTRKGRQRDSAPYKRELDMLIGLESILISYLDEIFPEANSLLQTYFDQNLSIGYDIEPIEVLPNRTVREKATLNVSYGTHLTSSYQYFLNEARLSAIALSSHLASLNIVAPPSTALKLLYLDDVFIGMDTGNRIPLLKLLKEEFVGTIENAINPWQVVISTYDRHWYEIARSWLEQEDVKIYAVELFVGNPVFAGGPEKPVLIQPGLTAPEKAHAYFEKHDYPAAANAIRKACEGLIKEILPRNMKLKEGHKEGEIFPVRDLEELFNRFKKFAVKEGISLAPFTHFHTYKKILLNALSHDNADAPHYKKEIEDGLRIMKAFQDIKVKEHYTAEECAITPFKIKVMHSTTGNLEEYSLTALENLVTIKIGSSPGYLRQVPCILISATYGTREFSCFDKAHDAIWEEQGHTAPTNYEAYRSRTQLSRTKTMDSFAKSLD